MGETVITRCEAEEEEEGSGNNTCEIRTGQRADREQSLPKKEEEEQEEQDEGRGWLFSKPPSAQYAPRQ
eukprot:2679317-Rhodomonas_salina.3